MARLGHCSSRAHQLLSLHGANPVGRPIDTRATEHSTSYIHICTPERGLALCRAMPRYRGTSTVLVPRLVPLSCSASCSASSPSSPRLIRSQQTVHLRTDKGQAALYFALPCLFVCAAPLSEVSIPSSTNSNSINTVSDARRSSIKHRHQRSRQLNQHHRAP